ncbi:hypothetical protein ACQ4PT_052380 [Festuca glaucescens]
MGRSAFGSSAQGDAATAEVARKRQEEENAAIRLVHLLISCANAIQAGDYAAATGNLAAARTALATTVSTAAGIGRVLSHFAAALAQRLIPAFPTQHGAAPNAASSAAHAGELYRQFYEAGPYLKFAHFTANQAILEAFEGCDRVHVIDLAIMQGVQWPALIEAFSLRPGGPPAVRITGVGAPPAADGARDELHEVGVRLAELARALNVPFSFHVVTADSLDALQQWMFRIVPGEALAVNSVCQLHRLLVDPDAAPNSWGLHLPSPIDAVLGWVAAMQPRVFTVVEQEADHNKPSLVERFINALFYYAAVLDSMEALSAQRLSRTGRATTGDLGAEAYLQREIFNIVEQRGQRPRGAPRAADPLACPALARRDVADAGRPERARAGGRAAPHVLGRRVPRAGVRRLPDAHVARPAAVHVVCVARSANEHRRRQPYRGA